MKRYNLRLKFLAHLQALDRTFAILGVILSLIILIFSGVSGEIVGLMVGILLLISCLLWLAIGKNDFLKYNLPVSQSKVRLWAICYFILYTASILSVYFRSDLYERPLLYFILIAIMAGAMACEILTVDRRHTGFILVQIVLLGMNLTWMQQLITPGLIGIDPWYHSGLTNSIIKEGILPLSYNYSALPIFHLLIATTSIVSTLPYKFAALVSVSFGQIFCNAFFIFLIGNYLFKNHRIGLLAALLVIISDFNILMSYWPIPNGFGAIFIVIILYLLFKSFNGSSRVVVSALAILIQADAILTHSIVALCTTFILFVTWGTLAFHRYFYSQTQDYVRFLIPMGFAVAMFAWWMYMTDYLNNLADFFAIDIFKSKNAGNAVLSQVITLSPFEMIFSTIGKYLFLTISLIGILYMISRKGNISTFLMALVSFCPLFIVFIGYLTNSDIIGYRWLYFSEILLSIPLALALYLVISVKIKRSYFHYLFFIVFIGSLSFFMVMSPYGNNDNHYFTPNSGELYYYTQAELVGSDFFAFKSTGKILSDDRYANSRSSSIFRYVYDLNTERLGILDLKKISDELTYKDSLIILRSRYISNYQKEMASSSNIQIDIRTYMSHSEYNKIFDNSALTGYIG